MGLFSKKKKVNPDNPNNEPKPEDDGPRRSSKGADDKGSSDPKRVSVNEPKRQSNNTADPPKRNSTNNADPKRQSLNPDTKRQSVNADNKRRSTSADNKRQSLNADNSKRRSVDPNAQAHPNKALLNDYRNKKFSSREEDPALLAELLQKEKQRQIQKAMKQKEKELQKKLEQHQHQIEKDKLDSDESIYVAAPAPENNMSTVKLVDCGVRGYRKCLFTCTFMLLLVVAGQSFAVVAALLLPMGFGRHFESAVTGTLLSIETEIMIMASQTCLVFFWLLMVTLGSRRNRICCCKSSTHWCLRGYYAYSVYLLIIPFLAAMTVIVFIGRLDQDDLEIHMYKHINIYEAVEESKIDWDEVQDYLECCGVKNGWQDWRDRDRVQEDVNEWIVPESCCRKGLSKENKLKCINETTDALVWNRGCSESLMFYYTLYGNLVAVLLGMNMFFHCLSVYFATRLYAAIRESQDPTFKFYLMIYCIECCCCCRRCRPVVVVD